MKSKFSKKSMKQSLKNLKKIKKKGGGNKINSNFSTSNDLKNMKICDNANLQLGTEVSNLPNISENAFENRYNWYGNDISGSRIGSVFQDGGKKSKKSNKKYRKNNKKSLKKNKKSNNKNIKKHIKLGKKKSLKKNGGGYYKNLSAPQIAGQAVVVGYDDCDPPTLENQFNIMK
jgi:hypothetical protein